MLNAPTISRNYSHNGLLSVLSRVEAGLQLGLAAYRFSYHLRISNHSTTALSIVALDISAVDGHGDSFPLHELEEEIPLRLEPHRTHDIATTIVLPTHWGTIDGWLIQADTRGWAQRVDLHRVYAHTEPATTNALA